MSEDLRVIKLVASDFFNLKKNRIFQRIKQGVEQFLLDVEFLIIGRIERK